jgi:hypothetical protein
MKVSLLLPLLFAYPTLATPTGKQQTPLGNFNLGLGGYTDLAGNVLSQITTAVQHLVHGAETIIFKGKKDIGKWLDDGREFILQNGLVCKPLQLHPRST